MPTYTMDEAEAGFSELVEPAALGEEVVIAKAGEPVTRLVGIEKRVKAKRQFGQNVWNIRYIAPDFPDDLPLDMWEVLRDDEDESTT